MITRKQLAILIGSTVLTLIVVIGVDAIIGVHYEPVWALLGSLVSWPIGIYVMRQHDKEK